MFRMPVGTENFDEIRQKGSCYVDKSGLIYELVNNTDNKVTLFTRPRRFGKTLMMSMIESFFDIRRDSRAAFEGLAVTEHQDFCENWMNQYPVVFVSFKDVKALNFDGALDEMRTVLANACKKMAYLEESPNVDPDDKALFTRLKAGNAAMQDIKSSLLALTRMMNAHFGKKVILLIDEYDVPLAKANEKRYYAEMLDVVRAVFEYAVKTNEYLQFAVVTGCLRVARESIFTGMNNLAVYSVLDNRFSEYFGFTQAEVNAILKMAGQEDKAELIKSWYDGYIFGGSAVYCPWDVANYVAALVADPGARPKNYWANTSHNAILRSFVGDKELKAVPDKFETLMNGGAIRQTVVDSLTYEALNGSSEDELWSILLMTGYLTKARAGDEEDDAGELELRIPNKEIASLFQTAVVDNFKAGLDRTKLHEMMEALWSGDEIAASTLISDFLWNTVSYNNYHEDYYHAFLAGIFTGLGYSPASDRERGLGRADIELKDRPNRRALIIEAKKAGSEKGMEKACDEALEQIAARKYAQDSGLRGYKTIICYGVSFFEKEAMVKRLRA